MQSFDDLPVQDEEKTESLVQALGEDRYLDLISLVPPEVEKILARYGGPDGDRAATTAPEAPDRRRDAHTLKGLAGNYGLSRLEHTARALEAEHLSDAELDQLLGRLQTCIDEIITIGNR
ncbi:Hpt domain-containing protein [Hwanghaeella sp.]|uniref:Hpt domain-containing protein n=1 Tax=Hwanghaeella sp. TaxID=2605943 RepID=UPI003CCC3546